MTKEIFLSFWIKTMQHIYLMIGLLWFFSCTATKTFNQAHKKRTVDAFINKHIKNSELKMQLGIKIVSLADGATIYEFNGDKLMTPASTNKLFTSAASIHHLPQDHSFKTILALSGNNLILRGGADPGLSFEELNSLSRIVSKKVNMIDTLFIDDGIFDLVRYGEGWMWDEGSEKYSAAIGGLNLHGNCIDFICSPTVIGETVQIELYPKTDYISFTNNSMTVSDTLQSNTLRIDRDWLNQTNHFNIIGSMRLNSENDTLTKNIQDPTAYVSTVFREQLYALGVKVNHVYKKNAFSISDTLALHKSKTVLEYLTKMMFESDNLIAESLIKYISANDSTVGNWRDGMNTMKLFLHEEVNLDTNALRIVDGSGLSRYNLISPNQVVGLLQYMNNTKMGKMYKALLPHGDMKDSGLENRFKVNSERINAKTGTLSGVSCLSGYIVSPQYGPLAFSIMTNGFVGSVQPYRKFKDEICLWLMRDTK